MSLQNDSTPKSKNRREFLDNATTVTGLAALAAIFASGNSANAHPLELNAMGPTPEQSEHFFSLPDRPVVMVNLLKFSRNGAGAAEDLQYAADVTPILKKYGAEKIFEGMCQGTFIGGAEWDRVALVRYPNPCTLMEMSQSEEFRAIVGNRTKGLDGQINLAVFES